MDITLNVSFRLLFVYFVTMGRISTSAYVIIQSINYQSREVIEMCAPETISLAGNYTAYGVYSVYAIYTVYTVYSV